MKHSDANVRWVKDFIAELAQLRLPNVFNPYADRCLTVDLADAPRLRRANLESLLTAALATPPDAIWLGQELGYLGGRRTGLALTDELRLAGWADRWGLPPFSRATHGAPAVERTAAVVWEILSIRPTLRVVGWNAFPLHAHEPGSPLTNRAHTRAEALATAGSLRKLLDRLHPKRLIAIGTKAENQLRALGMESISVRHPSFGGLTAFRAQMLKLHPPSS